MWKCNKCTKKYVPFCYLTQLRKADSELLKLLEKLQVCFYRTNANAVVPHIFTSRFFQVVPHLFYLQIFSSWASYFSTFIFFHLESVQRLNFGDTSRCINMFHIFKVPSSMFTIAKGKP